MTKLDLFVESFCPEHSKNIIVCEDLRHKLHMGQQHGKIVLV